MQQHNYFTYITSNPGKTVLYIGVTNDLRIRMQQHLSNKGKPETFAGRYFCYNLIWFEHHTNINHAIEREKEIKGWTRKKKEALINSKNPKWSFYDTSEF